MSNTIRVSCILGWVAGIKRGRGEKRVEVELPGVFCLPNSLSIYAFNAGHVLALQNPHPIIENIPYLKTLLLSQKQNGKSFCFARR